MRLLSLFHSLDASRKQKVNSILGGRLADRRPWNLLRRSNRAIEHVSVVTQADYAQFNFVDSGRGVGVLDQLGRDVLGQSGVR